MKSTVHIACAADLHLGRALPERSPAEALERLISWVIDNRVDALVLSGDLVDKENDFFEAYLPLKKACMALKEAQIPLILVAGNHDAMILPKIVDAINSPFVHFLGRGGVWESLSLELKGRPFRFDGWSCPSTHYAASPLSEYTLNEAKQGEVCIGLLHADAGGQKQSLYAPVPLSDFTKTPCIAWVLGHIHTPKVLVDAPHVFYPGSLQGLDPSENGERGFRLLAHGSDGELSSRFVPLAPLRFEYVSIEGGGADFESRLIQTLSALDFPEASHICVRLRLIGRAHNVQSCVEKAQLLVGQTVAHAQGGAQVVIEKVESAMRPAVDLVALAKGKDPLARLARKLLELEEGDGGLFAKKLEEARRKSAYFPLESGKWKNPLLEVGYEMLDELLMQKQALL